MLDSSHALACVKSQDMAKAKKANTAPTTTAGGVRVCATITVPLYNADVLLVVADDVDAAYHEWHEHDHEQYLFPGGHTFYDLNTGNFEVWLTTSYLDLNMIAHELFHLTHRISQWASLNFDDTHHEATAQLHGWLSSEIMAKIGVVLNKNKLPKSVGSVGQVRKKSKANDNK